MTAAEIDSGALFRSINRHDQIATNRLSAQSINLIIKRAATNASR